MNQGIPTPKKSSLTQQVATELKEVNALFLLALFALQHKQHLTEVLDTLALVQSRLDDLQAFVEDEAKEATV